MNLLEKIENILKIRDRIKTYESTIKNKEKEIKDLKEEKEELVRSLQEKKGIIDLLKSDRYKEVENSTFLVEFKTLKAFSIERKFDNNKEETVIGYIDKMGNIKEWYLSCSIKAHEILCDMFREQILK